MSTTPSDQNRSLSSVALFTLAFGAIVGASWIVLVGEWLQAAGPAGAALAFLLGGLIVLVVGYSYAELGSLFPRSGGELVFAMNLYGKRTAFAVAWVLLLLYLSLVAFESVSVAWILAAMFPQLLGPEIFKVGGSSVHAGSAAISIAISLVIALVNYRGATAAGRLQDWLTGGKILVAAVFIAFGFSAADGANFEPWFGLQSGTDRWRGFLLLLSSTPLFLAGFGVVTQAMGAAQPSEFQRLGKVLCAVIVASIVFYALVILVVAGLLPQSQLAQVDLPAARAFELAFTSKTLANVVLGAGLLGLLTVWNAVFFAAVRVMEGIHEQNLLKGAWLARRNPSRSAAVPTWIAFAISIVGALSGRSILLPIVSVGGFAVTLLFVFVTVTCLRRRRQWPDAAPPYAVPGGNPMIWTGIVLSFALVLTTVVGMVAGFGSGVPAEAIVVCAWALLGLGVWQWQRTA